MSDIGSGLGGGGSHHDEFLSMQRQLEEEGKKSQWEKLSKESKIAAFATTLIKNQLNELDNERKILEGVYVSADVMTSLTHFQELLEALKQKDLSQDYRYAEKLSQAWQAILQQSNMTTKTQEKKKGHLLIKELIKNLMSYPTDDEHALGFYLKDVTGEKWLPFPFMEIIRNLHEQFQDNGSSSDLVKFLTMVNQIIDAFREDSKLQ